MAPGDQRGRGTAATARAGLPGPGADATADESCVKDFNKPNVIAIITMLTGSAVTMLAACSASKPPAISSAAATKPSVAPQTTRNRCGG